MSHKHDMSDHVSKVDNHFLKQFCSTYNIGPEYKSIVPQPDHRITDCPDGYIGLYTRHFESSNIRIPFSNFFLDFLKHYKLNISQLSPLGAMKVTHFEIMCRALGGEPSLPLFRQFFVLTWNGDWYTVSQRRNLALCCIKWVPTTMPPWKDSFFWVSAEAIPFKMGWRHHDEPLHVIPPHTEHFDEKLYQLLVYHPTCLQRQGFPEHVLILAGLSRNWPHLKAEPVIMDGDKEMDLLKYIKKTGVGNAGVEKFTSRSLAEHEDHILERTKGICYEGTGSSGGDVEIHPEKSELIAKGKGPETVSEPASSSKKRDNVVVITIDDSGDETAPQTHVEEAPVSSAGNKRRGKQIVFTDESSSDNYEVGQTSAGQESVPEVVTRWYEKKSQMEARLRDRTSQYRLKMTCQHQKIRKLGKKVRKLKKSSNFDKGREAVRMLAKNTHEHAKVVKALKKELEEARAMQKKLKQEKATAAREKEGWMQERVSLEKSLERVWSERQWLIEEGFEYVIKKLHQSREFLEPLAAVESNLWLAGAHDGLVEGYANCKAGVALEHNRLFKPKAEGELTKAADELKNMQYLYVVALSKYRDRTLDELKALEPDMGMEDEGVGCSKKVGKAV